MTIKQRFIHISLFEFFALIIVTPLASFILNGHLEHMLVLTVINSLIASTWNFAFNYIFDSIEKKAGRQRHERNTVIRLIHTFSYQFTLILILTPFIAFWLDKTLIGGFTVEIGFICFFIIYTYIFNQVFDYVLYKWLGKKEPFSLGLGT